MCLEDNFQGIGRNLQERILERFGFSSAPSADLEGLNRLYAAWCAKVPFNNLRKMITLRSQKSSPLPGMNAVEFFTDWLADGAGGTCWPTSNALFELASSLGFTAQRIAGQMRDLGIVNHASVRVNIVGGNWLIDSSMLTNTPLPLNQEVVILEERVFAAEVEPAGPTHVVWWDSPPNPEYLPCRLMPEPVDHLFSVAAYERSRERSPFNQRLYARRNRADELLVLMGSTRISKSRAGLQLRELSAEEVKQSLHQDIGISEALVEQWVNAGGLEASFEPPTGLKPPPVTQKPPSRRQIPCSAPEEKSGELRS